MVDALEKAWSSLVRRGVVIDMQPDGNERPRVSVLSHGRRRTVGEVAVEPDPDILAAHAAIDRMVSAGRFARVARRMVPYRVGFASVAAFDEERRSHEAWRLSPGTRARLRAALAEDTSARIELRRRFSIAVLERLED